MDKKVNRKDLHEKVWSTPMLKLAKEFGLSDRGLSKICKKYNIPLPGTGYWAKIQWNKPVKQSPLPEPEKNDEITISVVEIDNGPIDEKQLADAEIIIASIKNQSKPTRVKRTITNLHPLIEHISKNLKNANSDFNGILSSVSGPYLGVDISKKSLGRFLRVMDCLIETLEKHGFTVSLSKDRRWFISAMILGEEIKFKIREIYHLVESKSFEQKEKSYYSFSKNQYDHKPSGSLTFIIDNANYISGLRTQWSDTDKNKLENRIDTIVIGLINAAVKVRSNKLKRQMIEKEWEEKRKLEQQRNLQRQEEEKRIENLNAEVKNWYESQHVRAYLEALKESYIKWHGKIELGSKAEEYFKWAFGYANRLDPLSPR
jgi:hypothetical protein